MFTKFNILNDDIIIGMEATGHYWLAVYAYLIEHKFTVKVINPIQSDAFRKMYIRSTKNDSKDSFVIAQLMRFGEYSSTELSDENIIALRQLTRYRANLVEQCGDCKRKTIALLDQIFPEYEKLFSDIFGVTSKEILLKFSTPEELQKVSSKKLSNLISKASNGRFSLVKAKEIKKVAKSTFGITIAKDAFSFQIKLLIEQLIFIENHIEEIDAEINKILVIAQYSLLLNSSSLITKLTIILCILRDLE
jgi:transposase